MSDPLQSDTDASQERVFGVKACINGLYEDTTNEFTERGKTKETLLTLLKSKVQILDVPHLAQTPCGIQGLEEIDFIDKIQRIVPTRNEPDNQSCTFDEKEGSCIGESLRSVKMVIDVMDTLANRVMIAESETAIEKEKVTLGQEEIKQKIVQIEKMSTKLEEMENFALRTNNILNELRQRVESLVDETSRQRQRAVENEQELCHVKRDFESLKSYVSSLISVRETLLSSEKQFQTIERLFERLVTKTMQLEGEKAQKEGEVQKLMEENVRFSALLDKKEAQLLAMNEQCKLLALSPSSSNHTTLPQPTNNPNSFLP